MSKLLPAFLALFVLSLWLVAIPRTCAGDARGFQPPAADRLTSREPGGVFAILPDGKFVRPTGRQLVVAPHPYGLALSSSGDLLVAASCGTAPFALTLVTNLARREPTVRVLTPDSGLGFPVLYHGVAISPDQASLYASGGDDGKVHVLDLPSGRHRQAISLNQGGFTNSLPAQFAVTPDGATLAVLDQGYHRLVLIDLRHGRIAGTVPTGRCPFALALSPDGKTAYVANMGEFEYRPVEPLRGADSRGLSFPPFGYPSRAAIKGTIVEGHRVLGLGAPNSPAACSVWLIGIGDSTRPVVRARVPTGAPVTFVATDRDPDGDDPPREGAIIGGSAPCALAASHRAVFVSNAHQDTVQELDPVTGHIRTTYHLVNFLPKPLRSLRGVRPAGLAVAPDGRKLYVALQGLNAIGVIDLIRQQLLGMIPVGWAPVRLVVSPDGHQLYCANLKGVGSGPNGGDQFERRSEGTFVGNLNKGSLSLLDLPATAALPALTRRVLEYAGARPRRWPVYTRPPVRHVVLIVKENRTFDEVFGGMPGVRGDARLARLGTKRNQLDLPGIGSTLVMPNHVQLARKYTISDNFYVDSDQSSDGHRWLVGVPPDDWVESVAAGDLTQDSHSKAPGRRVLFGSASSLTPEEYPEAGSLWHHLARFGISFRNWGEGFEFAGINEGTGMLPTGARLPLNIPMPSPLFSRTSRNYPGFNMKISDQYRADAFLREFRDFESGRRPLPRFMFIHLPNDHGASPRPQEGYPSTVSFMADNDLALGRIVQELSHSRFWKEMLIVVTEDDAQGGVDSIDAHRSILMLISPWTRPGFVSHRHADLSSIHRLIFGQFCIPPLSLADALASDLGECWASVPDFKPYDVLPVDRRLFDPSQRRGTVALDRGHAAPRMDDPEVVQELRRREGLE
jgi:YVTN family beta-propeller protein